MVAHHTDAEHVHAHVVAASVGPDGKRLRVDEQGLQRWRERFRDRLLEEAVPCLATPPRELGPRVRTEPGATRRMRERGVVPEVDKGPRENVREVLLRMAALQEPEAAERLRQLASTGRKLTREERRAIRALVLERERERDRER